VRGGGKAVWMTREIMAAVRRKKRAWKMAKSTGRMDEYKVVDMQVKKMICRAKSRFEKRLAEGGNSKPFYSYIKKKCKGRTAVGPLRDGDRVVEDNMEMAGLLNTFFSSVFTPAQGKATMTPEEETPRTHMP